MALEQHKMVTMGRIGRPYGVKGWVKLISYTDPQDNILDFRQLYGRVAGGWKKVEMDEARVHGKGLIAHFAGYDDPDVVRTLTGAELAVGVDDLPQLDPEDFYWHELVGMQVITTAGQNLGVVSKMLETGANDVLVVQPTSESVDDRERLIPYLVDRVVLEVSREQRVITVDWDPDYLS